MTTDVTRLRVQACSRVGDHPGRRSLTGEAGDGNVGERKAVILLVDLLGCEQRQALRAFHRYGHIDGHLADGFHFRTFGDQHFHAGCVAGGTA